jgi:hypothetical protein
MTSALGWRVLNRRDTGWGRPFWGGSAMGVTVNDLGPVPQPSRATSK